MKRFTSFFKNDEQGKTKPVSSHSQVISKDLLEKAKQDNVIAQYQVAGDYEEAGDYQKAYYWYGKASEKKFPPAFYAIGRMHARGLGVSVEQKRADEQAVVWYEWAAQRGHADAQYVLFLAYKEGKGVEKNLKKALFWLEKAAVQNHGEAQNKLGELYQAGDGVPQDLSYALYWFDRAVQSGYVAAEKSVLNLREEKISLKVPPKFDIQADEPVITMSKSTNIDQEELVFKGKIATGGMSVVYKATWHGQDVAVKQPDISSTSAFEREVKCMEKMGACAYIVGLYGVESFSIVIEYMPQGSLDKILYSKRPDPRIFDPNWCIQVCCNIALGLNHMHECGIVHRDIKSSNVLVSWENGHTRVKLADFGVTMFEGDKTQKLTGTIRWLPPEVLENEENPIYTRKTDMYSFGVVVWEITSHRMPFENKTDKAIKAAIRNGQQEPIPPSAPPKMAQLITACRKKPEARPTAAEAYEQLRNDSSCRP